MSRRVIALLAAALVLTTGAGGGNERRPAIAGAAVERDEAGAYVVSWRAAGSVDEVEVRVGSTPDETTTELTTVGVERVTFDASDLGDHAQRPYFELVPDGDRDAAVVVAERALGLDSAPNFRDLGGYETRGDRRVRWGTIFRSDALSALTDAELATVTRLGIKLVCDFRGPSEVEADGPDRLPPGAESLSLPIFDADNDVAALVREAITSGDAARQEELLGDGRGARILIDAGRTLVVDPDAQKQYRLLLERLADPQSLPAITHCTAGKDRTGWSSAIILTALGVPRSTVIEDYLLTNELVAGKNEDTIAAVAGLMDDPELLRPLLEVRKAYIGASFDAVEEEFGSFDVYLRDGLGIDKATLRALRRNLLE